MRRPLFVAVLLLLVMMPVGPAKAQDSLCFSETQQCLTGSFRAYWERNGGLSAFGFPLTPVQAEINRDTGKTYLTVWLERARFELHPEFSPPYDVLQGRLGSEMVAMSIADGSLGREQGPKSGCLWFSQTGHTVCDRQAGIGFMSYWQSHGLHDQHLDTYGRSLALFGLPLTAPRTMVNSSGDTVEVQWFERARFEWHPTQPVATRVLLGRLGSEAFNRDGATVHATSGITGLITIGPTCPVVRPGHPCADQPFQATVSVENMATQQLVTHVSSSQDGHFVLGLAPGSYTLHPRPLLPAAYPRADDVSVTVVANQFSDVAIHFDSGIR